MHRSLSPTRRIIRLLGMAGLVLAATWVGLVALALIQRLHDGTPINLDILAVLPVEPVFLFYLPILGAFLLLELAAHGWQAHPLRRLIAEDHPTDALDWAYLLAGLTGLDKLLILAASCGVSAAVVALTEGHSLRLAADLPLWAAIPLLYLVGGFVEYWGHRFAHSPMVWPVHALHHAAEDMTVLTSTRQHPADAFLGQTWQLLPAALLGAAPDAMLITMLIFAAHVTLQHSSLPFPLWLEGWIAGPRAHRIHHGKAAEHHDCNFSSLAFYDRMFGTFRIQADVSGVQTGVVGMALNTGHPVADTLTSQRAWLSGLWSRLAVRPGVTQTVSLMMLLAAPALTQTSLAYFGAEGGDFRATLSDGRTLRGADLIGATLNLTHNGEPIPLRIDAAERDTNQPDVWLFSLTLPAADGGRQDYCMPDPDGRSLAMPYPAAGEPLGFGLTCSSGAVGKCIRFGYRPWAMAPDGRTSLAPYHAACVNLIRGAYTGPERAWTRDGMGIDIFDDIGVQRADMDPGHAFEAGWTEAGAVCVAHPRVPENGSLEEIAAARPALAERIGPAGCTHERARALGALVYNRSAPPG